MAKQTVNLGSTPDDGSGDPLRTAFSKLNQNFDELYSRTSVYTLASNVSTAADTNPVSLTGLVWSYEANSKYFFRWIGGMAPAADTTGCGFQIDVSTAVTDIKMSFFHQLANTGTVSAGSSVADDTSAGVSSGMPAASPTVTPVIGHGMLTTSSTPGTAQLRVRAEVAAVTTAVAGLTLIVEKIA